MQLLKSFLKKPRVSRCLGPSESRTSEENEKNRKPGLQHVRDPRMGARLVCAAGLQLATKIGLLTA